MVGGQSLVRDLPNYVPVASNPLVPLTVISDFYKLMSMVHGVYYPEYILASISEYAARRTQYSGEIQHFQRQMFGKRCKLYMYLGT